MKTKPDKFQERKVFPTVASTKNCKFQDILLFCIFSFGFLLLFRVKYDLLQSSREPNLLAFNSLDAFVEASQNQFPNKALPPENLGKGKVDVVYTYVNGSDALWVSEKAKYSNEIPSGSVLEKLKELLVDVDDNKPNRYKDNNELKYSMRSIQRFVPWINIIHVVVASKSQIPSWLNTSHPRINIVLHEEIFHNKDFLPTFNSMAIEAQIHQIPNLAENFFYMNDDFYFGKEVFIEDFYTRNNGQKIYLKGRLPNRFRFMEDLLDSEFTPWHKLNLGSRDRIPHMPHFLNTKRLRWVHNHFTEEFKVETSHRFRHHDVDLSFLYYYSMMQSAPMTSDYKEVWSLLDTDGSGDLDFNELRTVYQFHIAATRKTGFFSWLFNLNGDKTASRSNLVQFASKITGKDYPVRYNLHDSTGITSNVFYQSRDIALQAATELRHLGLLSGTKFEIIRNSDEVTYVEIGDDDVEVQSMKLDKVRMGRTKFICIQDKMEGSHGEQNTIRMKDRYGEYLDYMYSDRSDFEL